MSEVTIYMVFLSLQRNTSILSVKHSNLDVISDRQTKVNYIQLKDNAQRKLSK